MRPKPRPSAKLLPSPHTLGLPAHFTSWRPGQAEAIMHLAESDAEVRVLNLPTGVGKSLIYFAWVALAELRSLFLTATRGLEDQLGRDFESFGVRDIRGAGNYPCQPLLDRSGLTRADISARGRVPSHLGCDSGPCRGGMDCHLRLGGCDYYDAVRSAQTGSRITSNYSYAMHQRAYADGLLGAFDAMICDEAHSLDEEIARFLRTQVLLSDVRRFLGPVQFPSGQTIPHWSEWATAAISNLPLETSLGEDHDTIRALRNLRRDLTRLQHMPESALMERRETDSDASVTVEPLWPGQLARSALFGDCKNIVLSSATIRPKTLDLLGLDPKISDWHEAPSPFAVARRPFTWVHTARIDYRSRSWFPIWMRKIDNIIAPRLDTKGMIHSVSYQRAREIRDASRHSAHMLIHDGHSTARVVEQFRRAKPPCILVSPAVTTGWDFPGDLCRWQILSKVPFVPTQSPIMKARCKADRDYADYLAMVTIVQAYGRIMRAAGDWGECVSPDARVLTSDLYWIPAGDLRRGQRLLTVDESGSGMGIRAPGARARRKWRWAEVERTRLARRPRLRIILEDREVICTPNHPWLVFGRGSHSARMLLWRRADELTADDQLVVALPLWSEGTSWEHGWASGFMDGEGCLGMGLGARHPTVSNLVYNQALGRTADKAGRIMEALGFDFYHIDQPSNNPRWQSQRRSSLRGGWPEILRFLGEVRPERLLQKLMGDDLRGQFRKTGLTRVIGVEKKHPGAICLLQTSSLTYLAEGLVAHNSFIVDDHWQWFQRKARKHAPNWFWSAVRESRTIPDPIRFN